jgi:phosphatidylglycerophosphatase A
MTDVPPPKSIRAGLLRKGPAVWLATGGWLGFFPYAPGTVGSLWGLPVAWGVGQLEWWGQALVIVLLGLAGVPLCTAAARKLGLKDPGCIVVDEIASFPITFFLVPMTGPQVIVAGFVLNRVFDITKPPPARQLERLPQGLGIMADDWAAGVYSNLLLHLLGWAGVFTLLGG